MHLHKIFYALLCGLYGYCMSGYYMCLCLAVWWLVLYAYVSMLVCGVVRVCVLCHVLVVYSLSVLEWLGCLSYAVAGGSVLACGLPWCLYLVTYVLTL